MAVSPVFVASTAVLKSKLRLSGVAATSDADDIIDDVILTVRTRLYKELGASRINSLKAITYVENPETANQLLRAEANIVETKACKAELMRALPMMFMDGNASQGQIYHDEAAFREASQMQLNEERTRLLTDVELGLESLRGSSDPGSDQKHLIVATISPDCRPQPGDTIRRWRTC